ncbi:NAD-dependent epimerase/dehydratase family protein [Galbibacter sp. BG1]|uniref:NAD-dependent epimerase/dehydratase family protein n=1 Tax=Galbibacter sp. BG1 TaxID=1170699 RepID=UPI0015BECB74|nr:NAD-dependent epimerase/dehydratase family protein [Galbibacter sp. BG1]QLE01062.1 NAD-dependent epimerase/dehydratase family protein [Galbibacter sp. BG1]
MILVTGGTGLIGAHLLLALAQKEEKVKAIYRTKEKIALVKDFFTAEGFASYFGNIEWQHADITDIPALESAFVNVTHVYHCAGLISFDPSDYKILRKTNIEGTANIVNLCIANQIEKLCHLSSIATLGKKPAKEPIDETAYWNPEAANNAYAITKYGGEMEVWRGTQEGVNSVILNPGVVLGEGFKDSPSNAFFKKVKNGLSYYPPGGTAFVDVKDVVESLLKGMNSNITKERFLVIAENVTYKYIFDTIAEALKSKKPSKKIRKWQLSILWRIDWFLSLLPWKKRQLTKIGAHLLLIHTRYSNHRAKEKLQLEFTAIAETIQRIASKYS